MFLLLNFLYVPSCGRYSCSYQPAWFPTAHAADDCPTSIHEAMADAAWAADRLARIRNTTTHITTGHYYDEHGQRHIIRSGDEHGTETKRAEQALRDVGAPQAPNGSYPAASHVEVKIAAIMRERGATIGVVIINRKGGPCEGDAGLSCQEVLPLILPQGATLRVWHPTADGAGLTYQDFPKG